MFHELVKRSLCVVKVMNYWYQQYKGDMLYSKPNFLFWEFQYAKVPAMHHDTRF